MKRTKPIRVEFQNHIKTAPIYNSPTFKNLFNRVEIIDNKVTMNVNFAHYSDINRMASIFNYTVTEL